MSLRGREHIFTGSISCRSRLSESEGRLTATLPPEYEKVLKKNKAAWKFFQAQPAFYRKAAMWWIVSAKQEATRLKRLDQLIDLSARQQQIPQFRRRTPSK